jgi:hypothetical protein
MMHGSMNTMSYISGSVVKVITNDMEFFTLYYIFRQYIPLSIKYTNIKEKKDAESQSKHKFILYVNQLHVSTKYSHHKAEYRTINNKRRISLEGVEEVFRLQAHYYVCPTDWS